MGSDSLTPSAKGGYLGLLHRDVALASNERHLTEFIAAFKHALLFTPRLILADHMVFSPNFEKAYRKDRGFRDLLGADFIDVAYFENRGIYLTPPAPRCSVWGHGRGLSEDIAGVGAALLHRGSLC
jgi:hypothetical protein